MPLIMLALWKYDDNTVEITMIWRLTLISLLLIQPAFSLVGSMCDFEEACQTTAISCNCCCGDAHGPAACPCIVQEDTQDSPAPAPATSTARVLPDFSSFSVAIALPELLATPRLASATLRQGAGCTSQSLRLLLCIWQT